MLKYNAEQFNVYSDLKYFYDWKKKHNIPKREPFCTQWKNNNKIFNYIGTNHTADINSSTFLLINKIITQYKPSIVIIEGFKKKQGINPQIQERLENTEMGYAAKISKSNNIDYTGIETSDVDIYNVIKNKYKIEDIYGYCFLQLYRILYKTKHLKKREFFKNFYEVQLKRYQTYMEKIEWNHDEWFIKTFNKPFVYSKYRKYSEPNNNADALVTQKISAEWHKIRDTFNIQTLYKYLNTCDNVVYIMGQNHVFTDLKIISESFGNYNIILQ